MAGIGKFRWIHDYFTCERLYYIPLISRSARKFAITSGPYGPALQLELPRGCEYIPLPPEQLSNLAAVLGLMLHQMVQHPFGGYLISSHIARLAERR